ncbi:MAG: hypothetical protein KDG44_02685 [Burkholderiaceae bacterium]|nr:hypothetical protein [Burkholderiaceae bacterium]
MRFTQVERDELLGAEPWLLPYVRSYLGAEEFLKHTPRYCLWLLAVPPALLARSPRVLHRLDEVRRFRLASKAQSTRRFAETPGIFCQVAQPDTEYLLVPLHTSESRRFIPVGYMPSSVIASNACGLVPDASLFHFGTIQSSMHNAWVRYTCGRLESRYRYSKDIVYNNFPWPESPTDAQRAAIESAAQAVLDTRAQFPGATLADLYDPLTMPPALLKAHQKLDAAVDAAYGRKGFKTDAERVAFLFEQYRRITSLLPAEAAKPKRRAKAARQAAGGG